MENLSFQYPTWWMIVVLGIALAFALFLYIRNKKFASKATWLPIVLGILRFSTIALIGFLLLGPLIKSSEEQSKKPIIVVAQDNSQSVGHSLADQDVYKSNLKNLISQIEQKYDVDYYSFGEQVASDEVDSLNFGASLSNINDMISHVSGIYEGENLGALVMATDGIYNDGQSPIYAAFKQTSPIYTLALGDTTQRNDLILKRVMHNEIAYLNDKIEIQIDIQAFQSANRRSRLKVEKKTAQGFTQIHAADISIESNNYYQTVSVPIEMTDIGVNQYRCSLSPLNSEENRKNNVKTIFIDVLDARQNILLLASAPHPDIAAIKTVLAKNKNYEVTSVFKTPSESELNTADFVIFYNLPSSGHDIHATLTKLNNRRTPRMFVVGGQTNLTQFNKAQDVCTIKSSKNGSLNEVQATYLQDFSNFTVSKALQDGFNSFPPMQAPFGEYQFDKSVQILLNQKIGTVDTDYPLLAFNDAQGLKTAFLFAEGLWRWRLYDYLDQGNWNRFEELINKSIIYTSTKEDKRKFRASSGERVYRENEEIWFTAELYNNSYELVNDADISVTITNENNDDYTFAFSTDGSSYSLNAGSLPVGNYRYTASTQYNAESYNQKGRFSVSKLEYELYDLQANHNILHTLANKQNGKVFLPNQMEALAQEIVNNKNLKPVLYQTTKTKSILDMYWLLGALVLLLLTEWFLRRYFGSL